MPSKPCILQQNDFGGDGSVLIGICKSVDPELESYVAGGLPRFDIPRASISLENKIRYWPDGTVFVSVVDPGVGTERRSCVARLKSGGYVITPDNGTLTLQVAEEQISEVRQIDEAANRLPDSAGCEIFHGRDLFAYTAARLAAGQITFEDVGPAYPVEEIVTYQLDYGKIDEEGAHGYFSGCMQTFGNLETNIRIRDFEALSVSQGSMVRVVIRQEGKTVFDRAVLYHKSFGYAPPGGEILYNSSTGFMGLGLNKESFMERYGVGVGKEWTIDIKP